MKCPRCSERSNEMAGQIKGRGADAFEVDTCNQCKGLWLDANELNKLDDNLFVSVEEIPYEQSAESDTDPVVQCPRCHVAMDKVHPRGFANVVVDNCPECKGFWLDAGELETLKDVSDELLIRSLTT